MPTHVFISRDKSTRHLSTYYHLKHEERLDFIAKMIDVTTAARGVAKPFD